jgi:hypothetical protein
VVVVLDASLVEGLEHDVPGAAVSIEQGELNGRAAPCLGDRRVDIVRKLRQPIVEGVDRLVGRVASIGDRTLPGGTDIEEPGDVPLVLQPFGNVEGGDGYLEVALDGSRSLKPFEGVLEHEGTQDERTDQRKQDQERDPRADASIVQERLPCRRHSGLSRLASGGWERRPLVGSGPRGDSGNRAPVSSRVGRHRSILPVLPLGQGSAAASNRDGTAPAARLHGMKR